ncbi:MAG: efflux RND transporter periplasmic adaptor subunit [Planctomycetota bacterium]
MTFLLPLSPALSQEPKPVKVDIVVVSEVKSGRRVVGSVEPRRVSTVGSAVVGRLDKMMVDPGQPVQKGEPIAQLLTATLKIELAAAQAELELFKQQKAELENGSRPEDIAEAQANHFSAKASLQNASNQLTRVKSLAVTKAASTSELDEAQQRYEAARFSVEATDALLKRITTGARKETIAQAAARVELQKQRCELLVDRISKCTIRAPFDGFVSAKFTEVGAWISQGDPIAEIIQLDVVDIVAPVTAEAAVNLRAGTTVRIEFPELPDELLIGTIDRVVPSASAGARTFPVRIRVNENLRDGVPLLLAGMLARVDLPAGDKTRLPLVPKDALVLNGNDRAIFVVEFDPDEKDSNIGVVRKVPVTLGVASGKRIQVKGDVQAGAIVVVVGNERLQPGATVKTIRQPASAPDATDLSKSAQSGEQTQ